MARDLEGGARMENDGRVGRVRTDPERPGTGGPEPAPELPGRLSPMLRWSFVFRGVSVWVGVHLAMAFFGSLLLSPAQVGFLLLVVCGGVVVDQRVRREDLLLGNAGIPPWVGPAHAVTAAAIVEGVMQLAAAGGPR